LSPALPDVEWAEITSLGNRAEFAILPPQNATGSWVKEVPRRPCGFK
jgi:multidrug resistance efflux pump